MRLDPDRRVEVKDVVDFDGKGNKWNIDLKLAYLDGAFGPNKEYQVWVHNEYLRTRGLDEGVDSAIDFALRLFKRRFDEVGGDTTKITESGAITDGSQIHYGKRENFPMSMASWSN